MNWVNKLTVRGVDLKPGTAVAIKVVAVVGYAQDWAAYLGPSDWSDEDVAEQGDKIEEGAARSLFPTFADSIRLYRD